MALGRKQVVDRLRVEGFNANLARNSSLDISGATYWPFCLPLVSSPFMWQLYGGITNQQFEDLGEATKQVNLAW